MLVLPELCEEGQALLIDADPGAWLETQGHERALADLAESERARARRFRRQRDRDMYVAAHALLRRWVGDALEFAPAELVFTDDPGQRPELREPGPRGLVFNLSHTRDRVALILARGLACGVDVEHVDRGIDPDELAARVYAPSERAWLAASEGTAQKRDRFFRLWTVKEAYSKARGLGFALDFPSYEFDVSDEGQPQLVRSPQGTQEGARWRFGSVAPTERHRMAWAVARGPRGPEPRVVRRAGNGAPVD